MEVTMKKQFAVRFCIYLVGMLLIALGVILNTKAGLGASAIISVPYTISEGTGMSLANLTLITYCVLVVLQFFVKGKNRQWIDVLQIAVSVLVTRFMALVEWAIPYQSGNLPCDLGVMVLGIFFTGVGAAMAVDMQLIPNPGDGIVSSIADRTEKELGLCKNCVDVFCVACSLVTGLCMGNLWLGVGLGTIASMVGVGRVIYVFNHLALPKLQVAAGLAD